MPVSSLAVDGTASPCESGRDVTYPQALAVATSARPVDGVAALRVRLRDTGVVAHQDLQRLVVAVVTRPVRRRRTVCACANTQNTLFNVFRVVYSIAGGRKREPRDVYKQHVYFKHQQATKTNVMPVLKMYVPRTFDRKTAIE